MERSEHIGELIAALAKAQAEFQPLLKDSANPYYNSKYADLATVIAATRPALTKHGIAVTHSCGSDIDRQVAVVTTTLHCGEQWLSSTAEAPAIGKAKDGGIRFDAQTIGAAWTYLRRYTLQGLLGIASEDDDGNELVTENAPPPAAKKAAPQQPQLSPEELAKLAVWRDAFRDVHSVEEFHANILPLVKERAKEFTAPFLASAWPPFFRALNTVDLFNEYTASLPADSRSREFVIAYAEEAKKRGYIGDRATGMYKEGGKK